MKTSKTIFQNIALLTLILIGFNSCEKDFASIDSDVVNADNATNFGTNVMKFPVRAYNKKNRAFSNQWVTFKFIGLL
jgi:hypothetical protein